MSLTAGYFWRCNTCDWWGTDEELLRAPNPFDAEDVVCGCPKCKDVGDFTNCCDEPGCKRDAGCGWPTKDGGYRRTCGDHAHWNVAKDHP